MADLGTLRAKITADASGFEKAMGRARSGMKKFAAVAGTVAAAGGALATKVGIESAKAFSNFEASVVDAGAKAQATEEQMDAMGEAAIKAGQQSLFGASEAADAMGFLAQAGLTVNEQMNALPGTLQLATAGNLELSRAADIATDTMSGLGLEVQELGRVNDVLVKTANSANTNVEQLGQGLADAAPVASAAGLELEQVTAVLGKLATAGIKGSKGGVAVRAALSRLQDPSADAQAALNSVGITAERIQPMLNEQGLTGVIERVAERSANSSKKLTQIFGRRAGPKLQSLVNQGTDSVRQLRKELENAGGTAANVTGQKIDTLSGKLRIMRGSVQTAKVALGEELKPVASAVAEEITRLANDVTDMARKSDETAKSIRDLSVASREMTRQSGKLGITLSQTLVPALAKSAAGTSSFLDTTLNAAGELVGMNDTSKQAARGTQRLANEMGFLQSALNSVGIFSQRYSGSLDLLGTGTDRQVKLQEQLSESIEETGRNSERTRKIAEKLRKELQLQGKTITKATVDYGKLANAIAETTKEMVGQDVVNALGEGYDFASEKIGQAQQLLGQVGKKLTEGGSKAQQTTSAISQMKGETEEAATAAERFMNAFDNMEGPPGELSETQRKARLQQAQDRLVGAGGGAGRLAEPMGPTDVAIATPEGPRRGVAEEGRGKHTGLIDTGASEEAIEKAQKRRKAQKAAISNAQTLTSDIGNLAGALAKAGGASQQMTQAISGVSGAMQSVLGGLASGSPLGIASGVIGGITSLIQGFTGNKGGTTSSARNQKRQQRDFADMLERRFDRVMERREKQTTVVNIDASGALVGSEKEVGRKLADLTSKELATRTDLNFGAGR